LLLTGRRQEKLEALARELRERFGVTVDARIVELTDDAARAELVNTVAGLDAPAVLVNNAGFGRGVPFHADRITGQTGMVSAHVDATLELTHAVLPRMMARGAGWIVGVSSLASYLPLPGGAVYASTKAAVAAFSESIALELAPYGIRCQALLPGFTRTDFHRSPAYDDLDRRNRGLLRWMAPEQVVEISLRELERGRRIVVVPGVSNRLLAWIVRHMPRRLLEHLVARTRVPNDTGGET
jgi:hypothetical protein